MVFLRDLCLAIGVIVGFLVQPMGVIGMSFVARIWLGLYRNSAE